MARSCTNLGAKPGSLNLTLRATGSQGSFQAGGGGGRGAGAAELCFLKTHSGCRMQTEDLAEQKGKVRRW